MAKSNNLKRRQRILNAAVDLFVRYGYDKTTINDIAKAAGVSAGAIYLHFTSKDNLFEELIIRETQVFAESWLEQVDDDPQGGTIAGMYKNMLYALETSPFMRAAYKQDNRLLGNYLRKPDNFYHTQQKQGTRHEVVKMLQDVGAVRRDIDAKVIAHVMNMLSYGMIAMEDIMDKADIPPFEDVVEGIALMMDTALTPADGGNSEASKAVIQQIATAAKQQFEQARQLEQEQKDG